MSLSICVKAADRRWIDIGQGTRRLHGILIAATYSSDTAGARERMPRTSLVLGIVVTIMAGSLVDFGGRRQPHASHLMLIYVGADDCAPCRLWQRDVATSFRATPTFRQITYREVKSPTLFDILNDAYWPDDLRDYRAQLGRGAGVPMWMIVADRKVVGRGYGASQWHSAILPTLEALVR